VAEGLELGAYRFTITSRRPAAEVELARARGSRREGETEPQAVAVLGQRIAAAGATSRANWSTSRQRDVPRVLGRRGPRSVAKENDSSSVRLRRDPQSRHELIDAVGRGIARPGSCHLVDSKKAKRIFVFVGKGITCAAGISSSLRRMGRDEARHRRAQRHRTHGGPSRAAGAPKVEATPSPPAPENARWRGVTVRATSGARSTARPANRQHRRRGRLVLAESAQLTPAPDAVMLVDKRHAHRACVVRPSARRARAGTRRRRGAAQFGAAPKLPVERCGGAAVEDLRDRIKSDVPNLKQAGDGTAGRSRQRSFSGSFAGDTLWIHATSRARPSTDRPSGWSSQGGPGTAAAVPRARQPRRADLLAPGPMSSDAPSRASSSEARPPISAIADFAMIGDGTSHGS